MTSSEFENTKKRIKEENEKSLMAKGVCENIKSDWKNKYGFETVDKAKEKLQELKEERENKIAHKNKLMDKLEEMCEDL